uniref:Microtubule-associated protein n=1 Tax=Cacopsylla melanoneura TaxID=428564 RepID=A0A8D8UWL6_9HEMI
MDSAASPEHNVGQYAASPEHNVGQYAASPEHNVGQYAASPEKSCDSTSASSAGATGSNKVESTQIVSDKLQTSYLNWTFEEQMRAKAKNAETDGDNDSGVDENTQSKDSRTGGHLRSPLKSPSSRLPSRKLTPTRTPMTPKSPDGSVAGERKKLPMNKIQVGTGPSPNLKKVTSKIGSLQNAHYKPGGGKVKIENRKLEWKAEPRIAAKNDEYVPGGGDKKIEVVKLNWNAKSKVGSMDNATHKPGGGDKKIESVKLDFKDKAKPKVGSKDNLKHSPGGGTVKTSASTPDADLNIVSNSKIEDQKIDIKAQSKVGSLDNVKYKPGGGEKKIFDDKDYLKQKAEGTDSKPMSGATSENQSPAHSLSLSSAHSPSPTTLHQDS